MPSADEPSAPIGLPPAVTGVPGGGRSSPRPIDDATARRAAMLHARDDLLADEAALGEVDAGELVHVRVMGEGLAEGEVDAALGNAEPDAMGVVGGFGRFGEIGRHVGAGRDDAAIAERRKARIGGDDAIEQRGAVATPCGDDDPLLRQVCEVDLRAQPEQAEPLEEGRDLAARHVEEVALAVVEGDEVEQQLALRRQQAGEHGASGAGLADIRRHQVVEEGVGVLARHGDDAPSRQFGNPAVGHRAVPALARDRWVT